MNIHTDISRTSVRDSSLTHGRASKRLPVRVCVVISLSAEGEVPAPGHHFLSTSEGDRRRPEEEDKQ